MPTTAEIGWEVIKLLGAGLVAVVLAWLGLFRRSLSHQTREAISEVKTALDGSLGTMTTSLTVLGHTVEHNERVMQKQLDGINTTVAGCTAAVGDVRDALADFRVDMATTKADLAGLHETLMEMRHADGRSPVRR